MLYQYTTYNYLKVVVQRVQMSIFQCMVQASTMYQYIKFSTMYQYSAFSYLIIVQSVQMSIFQCMVQASTMYQYIKFSTMYQYITYNYLIVVQRVQMSIFQCMVLGNIELVVARLLLAETNCSGKGCWSLQNRFSQHKDQCPIKARSACHGKFVLQS